jgi:phosphoribosylcarboxyaminoimidazole (NCAIR) mutase
LRSEDIMAEPVVGVVMGSDSDWETMQHAARRLEELGLPFETRVVSAHRTPDLLFRYAEEAAGRGAKKLGGGCFTTILVFLLLWWLLGSFELFR